LLGLAEAASSQTQLLAALRRALAQPALDRPRLAPAPGAADPWGSQTRLRLPGASPAYPTATSGTPHAQRRQHGLDELLLRAADTSERAATIRESTR